LPELHAGTVSGGRPLTGGEFRQRTALTAAMAAVRSHLDDFTDPPAARRELNRVGDDPRAPQARLALQELMRYVRPGTEALIAVTALVAAVRALTD
jgi:hypothetical protein